MKFPNFIKRQLTRVFSYLLQDKKKGTSIASKLTGKKKTHFGDISWPLYLIWVKDLCTSRATYDFLPFSFPNLEIVAKSGLEVIGPNTSFLLQFDNPEEKTEWQADFQTSIEAMLNASETNNGTNTLQDPPTTCV